MLLCIIYSSFVHLAHHTTVRHARTVRIQRHCVSLIDNRILQIDHIKRRWCTLVGVHPKTLFGRKYIYTTSTKYDRKKRDIFRCANT